MKNLDLISKRILVISLSISALLLSVSLLIFSAKPANAQTSTTTTRTDDGRRYDAICVSPNNGAYRAFCIWNTQTGTYGIIQIDSSRGDIISSEKFW